MKDKDVRDYQMFTRVRELGAEISDSFAKNSLGAQKFTDLSAVIAELDEHGTAQSSGKQMVKANTGGKKEARAALRAQMEAIVRTAKRIASDMPGMTNNFHFPYNNSDTELINAARAFARDALPLKAEFVKREMASTFIDDLNAAIEEFEQASNSKNVNLNKRVTATAAIEQAIERGKKIVRDLDPIIRNKFRSDPATLAAWESASHTERPPRRKKTTQTTATQEKQTA